MSRGSSSTMFVPSALRLRQASRALHARTHEVWLHADTRRLRWLPERSLHCEISANSFTVRCSAPRTALACGAPLPTAGVSRWRVHIAHTRADSASISIGVCDATTAAAPCRAWTLSCFDGHAYVDSFDAQGEDLTGPREWTDGFPLDPWWAGPPPEGLDPDAPIPDFGSELLGTSAGATVEVTMEHDMGQLSFRTRRGPFADGTQGEFGQVQPAVACDERFPAGAALRPFVVLRYVEDDVMYSDSIWDEYEEEVGVSAEEGEEDCEEHGEEAGEEHQPDPHNGQTHGNAGGRESFEDWCTRRKEEGHIGNHEVRIRSSTGGGWMRFDETL